VKTDAVKLKARAAVPNTEHPFNAYQIYTKMLPFQHTVIFHLYSFLYSTGDLKVPLKYIMSTASLTDVIDHADVLVVLSCPKKLLELQTTKN
jgi:hypothetical protein